MGELPESDRRWACVTDDSEIYKMGFTSREAAVDALNGQAGELVCYERGFPIEVAAELFDIDVVLTRAEERSFAWSRVLWQRDEGLFDAASPQDLEDLRCALAAAVVDWVEKANLPILRIVEREEVELVTDAKDGPP